MRGGFVAANIAFVRNVHYFCAKYTSFLCETHIPFVRNTHCEQGVPSIYSAESTSNEAIKQSEKPMSLVK